jgi:DNA-binding transcriptional regulator/RsmH inhibitor MraZ
MRATITSRLIAALQALYRGMMHVYPHHFRAEFGAEMEALFGERLAAQREQGLWAITRLGWHELSHMPLALLRLQLYQAQKKRSGVRLFFSQVQEHSVFGESPTDDDGRFSLMQLVLELLPFIAAATLIILLTYRLQIWLPESWHDPLAGVVIWAGMVPFTVLLLGLARGMPRWAYPYGGIVVGYTLWTAIELQLVWLWALLLVAAIALGVMAVVEQQREQALPIFLQRLGTSIARDWTRLSFAVFGATPLFILAAFDNGFLNDRTPYLALSVLLLPLTVLLYGRCHRQDRQLAVLLGGATLTLLPALLDHVVWQGGGSGTTWLFALWTWLVALLLLPLFFVPLQWRAAAQLQANEE